MPQSESTTTAIAGLGITEVGKVYGRTVSMFAAEAVRLAAADAGIPVSAIDGLLVSRGSAGDPGPELQRDLNLRHLRFLTGINLWGTSAAVMVQLASMVVNSGQASVVACVLGDAPLKEPGAGSGASYSSAALRTAGWTGVKSAAGIVGGAPLIAMNARRHMIRYGTTSEQLGHVAVAQRAWATMNPLAQMRTPISLEDHQNSRWVCEPLHLLDCCLVSNGAVAIIVTTRERAEDMAQPAVRVLGWGQSNPGFYERADADFGVVSGAAVAGPDALRMAGLQVRDVDAFQLYDCFTYTVLVTLEDYGLCAKGEGGEFVASGMLGPKGTLPVNTGGGQLSSFYLQGMTPLSEGVIQARGQAGQRQVPHCDVVMVSGNGGSLDHHATLLLGSPNT